ncbi:SusC/RagA family TonB-linked outer membrane protein [Xanthomarina gelatinilytica]|uniref:SusC/RagA family TonB-linked outer membrane protein n=1 Tax=Xanthomarina gelatinilytica TaxID=1137281 RepID=UPI003AA82350
MKNNYRRSYAYALSFALFLTYNSPTFSQNQPQKTISGIITSGAAPLIGVNVLVKNSARGSISDLEGRYSVSASANDTLVFTYVGYKTQEVAVGTTSIMNVVMKLDAQDLDAVVINAGYYKVKNKERTGNISSISAEEIIAQPINNPLAAVQGRMAGVDIVETSGVPGSGFQVSIRGQNSLMGGNDPLYIIDGVPYDSRSLSNLSISIETMPLANVSPLNAINPANIESIEILKDADATAIYGSRGANGVVLITTKKGKEGKTRFSISSSTGIANIARKLDLLNTEQYLAMRREAFANEGITEYPANAYDVNGTWDQTRYTDWQEVLIGNTARTQNIQAFVSGGSAQTQFLLAGNYQKETTVFPGDYNYTRFNINSNVNHSSVDHRFNLLFNVAYALEKNKLPKVDFSSRVATLPPNAPALYDENGEVNWENSTWRNPIAAKESIYKNRTNTLLSNAVLSYAPFKNIITKLNLGYGHTILDELFTRPHTINDPARNFTSSSSTMSTNKNILEHYIVEPQLEWRNSFGSLDIEFLLGATYQNNTSAQQSLTGRGFPDNSFIENLQAATTITVASQSETVYSYQSFFSRLNLAFRNKLFLNLTGRRDGSSRFGPGNKYGNFGAIGAAWLFSEELDLSWLSLGKLRGSYGITGNDQIGDYQYLQSYLIGDSSYNGNVGLEPARLYNPNFQWEVNKKTEAGLELGFFKNKFFVNLSYYYSLSSNQLINYTLPATTGFTYILANLDAVVENKGFETELEGRLVQNDNFSWTVAANLTVPKNTLLEFPGLENSTYSDRFVIGQPLSISKLYTTNGVDPETGLFTFVDVNGDGQITSPEDRQYIADLSPKFYGGFSNSLQYKNWGLDFHFQFVKKKAHNQYYYGLQPGNMFNQTTDVLDHWQQPGDNAPMQQYGTGANYDSFLAFSNFSESNATISDASFVRLKSADLSYALPLENTNTSCRIALQGQNLLTFTKFPAGDPEQTARYLPSLRRITLNLQLQF